MNETNLMNVLGNLGSFGVLAYLAVIVLPKWIDRISQDRVKEWEERLKDREESSKTILALLQAFQSEQEKERGLCRVQFQEMTIQLERNQQALQTALVTMQRSLDMYHEFTKTAVDKSAGR